MERLTLEDQQEDNRLHSKMSEKTIPLFESPEKPYHLYVEDSGVEESKEIAYA